MAGYGRGTLRLWINAFGKSSILRVLVNKLFSMLTLYIRPTCAFCRRVMAVTDRLNLEVELKDISDESVAAELLARGGQVMVPYLVDESAGVELYESDAIVAHLQATYGVRTAPKVRMHISDNACVSCEG